MKTIQSWGGGVSKKQDGFNRNKPILARKGLYREKN